MNAIQKSAIIQSQAEDASLTIAAPGAGKYNCLTSLTVESSLEADVTITSGSKTWKSHIQAGGGVAQEWTDLNPWIGAENSTIVVAVSAGSYTINAQGFVTP